MTPENSSQKMLQGSLTGVILKLLSEGGRMYGYEITKAVREKTGGRLALTEAALYPALHQLLADGLLQTETETVKGRQRKYYRIAAQKKAATNAVLANLRDSLNLLQNLLSDYGTQKA